MTEGVASTWSRRSPGWFLLVGCGVVAWWAALLASPALRPWFVPARLGEAALWSFLPGDVFLLLLPAAWGWGARDPAARAAAAWWIAGALGTSALWSTAATLFCQQASLGPLLMLPAAGAASSVAWMQQPVSRWFRPAAPSSTLVRLGRTLLQALLFDAVFLVVFPLCLRLLEDEAGLVRWREGLALPGLALVLGLNLLGLVSGGWMAWRGRGTPLPVETAAELVVDGPYAWLRNPMASLGILQGVVLGLSLGSWLTVLYALVGAVLWQAFVCPIEEEDLERRFGASYVRYRAAVPLWFPRLRPWRGAVEADPVG